MIAPRRFYIPSWGNPPTGIAENHPPCPQKLTSNSDHWHEQFVSLSPVFSGAAIATGADGDQGAGKFACNSPGGLHCGCHYGQTGPPTCNSIVLLRFSATVCNFVLWALLSDSSIPNALRGIGGFYWPRSGDAYRRTMVFKRVQFYKQF